MNVLITSGGTREPIDGVRVITNSSTGATGAALADAFHDAGWQVTLLHGTGAAMPTADAIECVRYVTAADLDRECQRILGERNVDLVIHAAAVSDFVVDSIVVNGARFAAPLTHKLDSAEALSIALKPGKKILPHLKQYSRNPSVKLVGFKLTDGAAAADAERAVQRVFSAGADFVVHNDVQEMSRNKTRATVWSSASAPKPVATLDDLATALLEIAKSVGAPS